MFNYASPIDYLAVATFLVCWIGYSYFADHRSAGGSNLMTVMHGVRKRWMMQMLKRDNRMVDTNIMSTQMRSVGLFASTSIFIMAGLVAILGAVDEAIAVASNFPLLAVQASSKMWEIKVILLLIIFAYSFFKFAWALRQFNYTLAAIGSAPLVEELQGTGEEIAERLAKVSSLAVKSFNRGIRAYYFGLATLTWVAHPLFFILSSVWVVLVLYRREFRSKILHELLSDERE